MTMTSTFSVPDRDQIDRAIHAVLAHESGLNDQMLTVKVGVKLNILYDLMPQPFDPFHLAVMAAAEGMAATSALVSTWSNGERRWVGRTSRARLDPAFTDTAPLLQGLQGLA